jgi:hypothetical protein
MVSSRAGSVTVGGVHVNMPPAGNFDGTRTVYPWWSNVPPAPAPFGTLSCIGTPGTGDSAVNLGAALLMELQGAAAAREGPADADAGDGAAGAPGAPGSVFT